MGRILLFSGFILFFLIAACDSEYVRQQEIPQSSIKLKLLGQAAISYNKTFRNTTIGGLSGLAYDTAADQFYVISDDRSEKSDARFYTIQVHLSKNDSLKEGGIRFTDVSILKTPDMKSYQPGTIDAEGIALGGDQFVYVSSEGDPEKGIPPFINGYGKDGSFARSLTIPKAFWDSKSEQRAGQGTRTNLAFENLTTSPNNQILYAATENALIQDGPAADTTHISPARIIVYDLPSGNIMHEYQYNVDSVYVAPGLYGSFMVNGLSDLEALDNKGHLLALERNYVMGQGNHITLYEVSIDSATDIKDVYSIKKDKKPIQPVQKKLVARLSNFDTDIDNFEGLALGPELPDGGRLLLMVSDNNFSPLQQTLFTAFSLHMK